MGILDVVLGRTRPVKPDLDVLFAIPSAAQTLQASLDLQPTGAGAVCFKTPEGAAAAGAQTDITALLALDPNTRVEVTRDEYGYTWVTCTRPDADLPGLITDLHAVNTTLSDAGFGPALLCTVTGFTTADHTRRLGLVYLFKRGTVYPYAPTGPQARDTALELQIRAELGADIPVESDLTRWFPIWGAPVP
jgi:hypothetical protein